LVKARAYSEGAAADSANRALRIALSVQLRLLAPVLAFASEEVWSWFGEGSVHRASWPTVDELPKGGDPAVLAVAGEVLGQVRKAKSSAQLSMKTAVSSLVIRDTPDRLDLARLAEADLGNAGVVSQIAYEQGDPGVEATLAPTT
ncbi:MAG: valS, partial [Frankiales bacterium]|nr:valS [Frankiales bacterium]